jgi:hypothetical protein
LVEERLFFAANQVETYCERVSVALQRFHQFCRRFGARRRPQQFGGKINDVGVLNECGEFFISPRRLRSLDRSMLWQGRLPVKKRAACTRREQSDQKRPPKKEDKPAMRPAPAVTIHPADVR